MILNCEKDLENSNKGYTFTHKFNDMEDQMNLLIHILSTAGNKYNNKNSYDLFEKESLAGIAKYVKMAMDELNIEILVPEEKAF